MLSLWVFKSILLALLVNSAFAQDEKGIYNIGTGIGDITGPAAGVLMDGTINQNILAAGIHTRLYARSFIVESRSTNERVVFVSCDLGIFDDGLKLQVIKRLGESAKYTAKNVQISATHTQSGPAGYIQYYAYIAKYGFNPLTFSAIVDGIVDSIKMADAALTRGKIYLNKGDLVGYNENREPRSYAMNSEEERNEHKSNVDTEMISLKLVELHDDDTDGEPIGSFNWWPVQPIAFNAWDNPLISSDSRGYASVKFDYEMNKEERPGRGKFVSAFVASNLGDVNPRIPKRLNVAYKLEKVATLGQAQFEKALKLFNGDEGNLTPVTGWIDSVQKYVDMQKQKVTIPNPDDPEGVSETQPLCKAPALGYSFFGLDPAVDPATLPLKWKILFRLGIFKASKATEECQKPKTIAMSFGISILPWKWMPSKVDLNILHIGTIDIVSMPGEFTTMAGRRLKKAMKGLVPDNQEVIISGLANSYINSVATPEEYSTPAQGYAAGATLFGKYTLNAIIDSHITLMTALNTSIPVPDQGSAPFITGFRKEKIKDRVDVLPEGKTWGDVLLQPTTVYPGEKLHVQFLTPSLRHNPLRKSSHFLIQIQNEDDSWADVRTDADLDTTFYWNRNTNTSNIYWLNIPSDVKIGTYRVYHSGYFLEKENEEPKRFDANTETFQISETPSTTTAASTVQPTKEPTTTTPSSSAPMNFSSAFAIIFAVMIIGFRIF